jgi:hypothetical protein
MPEDIAEVVRAAEVLGLQGEELDTFILDSGNSIEDYRRYMRRSTVRVVAILLVLLGALMGAVVWWFWDQWGDLLQQ